MKRFVEAMTLSFGLSLALGLSGCKNTVGPNPEPSPTPVPRAVIKVLIDPDPVIAVASGDRDFPWDFRFNLQLSDSGGVAFVVTTMQTTITSAASGATLTATGANPFVGLKIPANGQETRQFHIGPYRMENFAREARINVKLTFVDDAGNASVHDGNVNVQHEGGAVRLDP
jgi:hypothetical protein